MLPLKAVLGDFTSPQMLEGISDWGGVQTWSGSQARGPVPVTLRHEFQAPRPAAEPGPKGPGRPSSINTAKHYAVHGRLSHAA